MIVPRPQPFAILGISPTLDAPAIKRGYFAALHEHPPHSDPDGFRRVRQAYEELTRAGGAIAAYMTSPPEIANALLELDAGIGEEIGRLGETDAVRQRAAAAKTAIVDELSRLRLVDALSLFTGSAP
jgi:hypothetical protein